jgi:hypothetical protein
VYLLYWYKSTNTDAFFYWCKSTNTDAFEHWLSVYAKLLVESASEGWFGQIEGRLRELCEFVMPASVVAFGALDRQNRKILGLSRKEVLKHLINLMRSNARLQRLAAEYQLIADQ